MLKSEKRAQELHNLLIEVACKTNDNISYMDMGALKFRGTAISTCWDNLNRVTFESDSVKVYLWHDEVKSWYKDTISMDNKIKHQFLIETYGNGVLEVNYTEYI